MRDDQLTRQRLFAIWLGWMAVAGVLLLGPQRLQSTARIAAHDAVGTILQPLMAKLSEWTGPSTPHRSTNPQLDIELAELRAENQALRAMLADLRAQDQVHSSIGNNFANANTLFQQQSVSTRILGVTSDPTWPTQREYLINVGAAGGLTGSELILDGPGLVIDAGKTLGLSPDQLVTVGRVLCGRAQQVGRWTSVVQPLHDPEFRIAVRIVRQTELGPIQGPRGVLRGQGDYCTLEEIPATAAIAIGDEIYTDPVITRTAFPVYCGRIQDLEAAPSATHWDVVVETAIAPDELPQELSVLKTVVNPERLAKTAEPTTR
ncbi:MAG: rod shape-determining protein MreC [Planctomycetaceae bacterium]|nr:rod shape-determining protein MreC [Planctomycetaceae bacterium]